MSSFKGRAAAALVGLALVPAWQVPAALAVPAAFTVHGTAVTTADGKTNRVPNTLHYQNGRIRLEMASPVSADGQTAFSVVLAQEGSGKLTMVNPKLKQAMTLDAGSVEAVTENKTIQKLTGFRLNELARTVRAESKKVGTEAVAGQACTVYEQKGKDGHFKLWLSDRHDLPLRLVAFQGGKPAFSYAADRLTLASRLPASSFRVPAGYDEIDLTTMLMDGGKQGHRH